MIDTLNMRCERSLFGSNTPLSVCSHIDVEREGIMASGEHYAVGHVRNYRVYADERRVRLSGSIAKMIGGTNIIRLSRKEVCDGIEFLSDELHLDIGNAVVSRVDVANTFGVDESPDAYIEQMMSREGMIRASVGTNTLYFASKKSVLCFYDKGAEIVERGGNLPLWATMGQHQGLLRYELRLVANIGHQIGLKRTITASDITQPDTWVRLVNLWAEEYRNIEKNATMRISAANTAREAFMAIYADMLGHSPAGYLQKAIDLTKCGTMTKKERYRLRQMIKEAENICLYTKLNTMVEKVRTEEMQDVEQALNRQKSTQ